MLESKSSLPMAQTTPGINAGEDSNTPTCESWRIRELRSREPAKREFCQGENPFSRSTNL